MLVPEVLLLDVAKVVMYSESGDSRYVSIRGHFLCYVDLYIATEYVTFIR